MHVVQSTEFQSYYVTDLSTLPVSPGRETRGFDCFSPVSRLLCVFSRVISAKSSHIFRIFPYNFLVYIRFYARAEDLSMNVQKLRVIMKVLFILLLMIIFVVIYLSSTILQLYIYMLLAKFGCLPIFGQISVFFFRKIQNLQVLKILG